MDKLISMEQAVQRVDTGCTLALGGITLYRKPMAFVKALLQRHARDGQPAGMTLLSLAASLESDLLVGAGMISRVRSCYFGFEIFGFAPMFSYYSSHGLLEVLEETEASLALGLRAQIAGIGFMPGSAWVGTDLPRLRPDVRTILDPYTGEELMAFPAIRPDVAVIHALRADLDGNAQIGDNKALDEELVLASGSVIVTAEEVVPELTKADVIGPLVQAVVLAPGGASPTSCHPFYPIDGEALLAYTGQVSDPESFARYIRRWDASET